MLKKAYDKDGIKGAIKAVPSVVKDIFRGEPNIRGNNGRRKR